MNDNYVYIKSHEKYVKAVMLYVDEKGLLHTDKELTKPITKDELKEAFLLGAFVEVNEPVYGILLGYAYALSDDGTYAYIRCGSDTFISATDVVEDAGVSLTAFEVGDVATQYVFDTSKEAELEAYLTELFAANPDNDQVTLISSLEGETNTKLLSAVNFQAGDNEMGPYALAIVDDRKGEFVWVYATDNFEDEGVVKGFQNLTEGKYVANNQYNITGLGDPDIADAFAPINGVIVGK